MYIYIYIYIYDIASEKPNDKSLRIKLNDGLKEMEHNFLLPFCFMLCTHSS